MEINFQTDVGQKRNSNQDYAGVFENKAGVSLAILADGMGGHQAGDVASKMAVNNLGALFSETTIDDTETAKLWFEKEIQAENQKIYQSGQSKEAYQGMGTTLVSIMIFDQTYVVANIGDSRAYLMHNEQLIQLTEDHSLVNELVKSGEISQEMAANHPRKNVLTRSLGMPKEVKIDIDTHTYLSDDYLIMCSDGLTNMVSEEDILSTLLLDCSLEEKIAQLIGKANQAGGADNITVLMIHFDDQKEGNQ